jgi:hypothetical protein
MAAVNPACASEVTSRTPDRPRALRSRKNASQPAPSSLVVTWTPRISRCPCCRQGVDPGRHQRVHRHHPAALADLQHQRVGGHERERTGLGQRPGAEVLHMRVQIGRHRRDLALREPSDAQRLDQLVHPPGGDPEQVAGRHHRGQRLLRPGAALQQPLGEVGAPPQLRDRHVQGAGTGVEVTVPVAVAPVGPLGRDGAVSSAADRIGLRGQQCVDERAEQLTQQIRGRLGQVLLEQPGRVDTGGDGHRGVLLRVGFRRSLEGSPGGRRLLQRHAHQEPYTTLPDVTQPNCVVVQGRRSIGRCWRAGYGASPA